MKLFHMKDWQLIVSEETWGLLPFKRILDRDKTKTKSRANAEMLYLYYLQSRPVHMLQELVLHF